MLLADPGSPLAARAGLPNLRGGLVFVGVMFVYWKLMNDRELVVMQSVGLSPIALARPALMVAVIATGIAYGLSLYLRRRRVRAK